MKKMLSVLLAIMLIATLAPDPRPRAHYPHLY